MRVLCVVGVGFGWGWGVIVVGLAWGRYEIGFGVGTTRGAMSSGYPCWYGPMRVFCFHRVFPGVRLCVCNLESMIFVWVLRGPVTKIGHFCVADSKCDRARGHKKH